MQNTLPPYQPVYSSPVRPKFLQAEAPTPSGVNVHCFMPGTGIPLVNETDFNLIQAAGFKKVRLDILWSEVEKQPGIYDFSKYDWIIGQLQRRGIQPMAILGLGNPLYAKGLTIQPGTTQKAFERYAVATVDHFKGKNFIWELVNEPNHTYFWQPQPNPDEYMSLARALLPVLKAIDPSGFIAAPSVAGVPLDFLTRCFQLGLLSLVDGVTIHPYQAFPTNKLPENFAEKYAQAKSLMQAYMPPGKDIPLLIGEWGYSTALGEVDEQTQANFLVRQALLGFLHGSPVNIWYDWKGDINGGGNPANKEHNFGLVDSNLRLKPAYQAMRNMSQVLNGLSFSQRLPSSPNDYLLQFANNRRSTIAAWTTGTPHRVTLGNQILPVSAKPIFYNLS